MIARLQMQPGDFFVHIIILTLECRDGHSRACPVGAISGEIKNPFVIAQNKCIKCGACMSTCKFGAIEKK